MQIQSSYALNVLNKINIKNVSEKLITEKWLQVDNTNIMINPLFLSKSQVEDIEKKLIVILDLLFDLPNRLFNGDLEGLLNLLGINEFQRHVFKATWENKEFVTGRADLYKDLSDSFKLLEFNIHSSTGGLENAEFNKVLLQDEKIEDFINDNCLTYTDSVDGIAKSLKEVYLLKENKNVTPMVAIVEEPNTYEFMKPQMTRFSKLLNARGLNTVVCHLGEIEYQNGTLYAKGVAIDIFYRTFVIDEIEGEYELLDPVIKAALDKKTILAMSFNAELIGNKGLLALLSDPNYNSNFNQQERNIINDLIPWTRLIKKSDTSPELIKLIKDNKDRYILKPTNGFGGKGVLPGWNVSHSEWENSINDVISSDQPYIVQEKVIAQNEKVTIYDTKNFREVDMIVNWGVFIANDRYNGSMLRAMEIGGDSIVNVSRGAAVGCVFHEIRN